MQRQRSIASAAPLSHQTPTVLRSSEGLFLPGSQFLLALVVPFSDRVATAASGI